MRKSQFNFDKKLKIKVLVIYYNCNMKKIARFFQNFGVFLEYLNLASERISPPCLLVAWCSDLTIFFRSFISGQRPRLQSPAFLYVLDWMKISNVKLASIHLKCIGAIHPRTINSFSRKKSEGFIDSISLGLNDFRLQIKPEVALN